eukprot:Skav215162  [mRNA]  locus=scaffold2298:60625:69049:+ [translate_table: standard]
MLMAAWSSLIICSDKSFSTPTVSKGIIFCCRWNSNSTKRLMRNAKGAGTLCLLRNKRNFQNSFTVCSDMLRSWPKDPVMLPTT